MSNQDEKFMRLALSFAKKGRARTESNPMVGAVIVKEGKVIGKGYHKKYGEAHAEVEAFNSIKGMDARGATMYVTLEPCCHYGKTPPCSERIIKEGISRVVIASLDPNPIMSGKGAEQLKKAGIEVDVGLCDEKQQIMNEKYMYYIKNNMPFVLLKSAITLDGKIATKDGNSKWITSEKSRRFTRKLRGEYQGIMVGINTIIADNPMLNTRIIGETNPLKIVVDSKLRIPIDSYVVENAIKEKLIILTAEGCDIEKRSRLENSGVQLIELPCKDGKLDLVLGMRLLAEQKISSILLEG
ncbi:MAG: bifunctional diaminohydroxyphosphoribosylaminopyrimidine deaminase/5-amino-6-(5-phosphoribosylamino)uracil reductase RibD, partial [Eubacteriales bacterium]